MVVLNNAMAKEKEAVLSFFYNTLSNGFTVQSVVLIVVAVLLVLSLLLICCVVCYSVGVQWKNSHFKSASRQFLDTSYRIFNEQKVHKSRISEDPVGMYCTEDPDERSPLRA
ncbi:hypothetical protein GCK32_020784, partial [Trichostrongylus colubriformis]